MNWYDYASLALAPLTGIVTLIAASTKRRNDSIQMLQETIDALVIKNQDLYNEIFRLRSRVNELEVENKRIKMIIDNAKKDGK